MLRVCGECEEVCVYIKHLQNRSHYRFFIVIAGTETAGEPNFGLVVLQVPLLVRKDYRSLFTTIVGSNFMKISSENYENQSEFQICIREKISFHFHGRYSITLTNFCLNYFQILGHLFRKYWFDC